MENLPQPQISGCCEPIQPPGGCTNLVVNFPPSFLYAVSLSSRQVDARKKSLQVNLPEVCCEPIQPPGGCTEKITSGKFT
jgi:hypothetical protein